MAETGDKDPAASTAGGHLSDLFRPTTKICHRHRLRLLPARAAGHQPDKIIGRIQVQATSVQASVQNADRLRWTELSDVNASMGMLSGFSSFFIHLSSFFSYLKR